MLLELRLRAAGRAGAAVRAGRAPRQARQLRRGRGRGGAHSPGDGAAAGVRHPGDQCNESAASGHVTAVLTCDWLQDLVNTAAMVAAMHSLRLEAGHPGTLWLAVLCLSPAQLIRSDNVIDIQYSNT